MLEQSPVNHAVSPARYFEHIDGLRAVAVLSVIFYHFGIFGFTGGFVGVDVFFVISGYLITKLILGELASTGGFDFARFYIRRMRRLFPALAVALILSLVFATLLFPPDRLQAFAGSLGAAVFSFSNIVFWLESGYFDAASHLKPLLHTWSLSVEEQFYFIWPALLWFSARKAPPTRIIYVLAAVGLISFGLNFFWVLGNFDADYASAIFYLTPFRIFELVIGAMAVFLIPYFPAKRMLHEVGMILGLALIGYAALTFTDATIFPYYNALLPCIGALLVILSAEARWSGWILKNRLAVGVGLISYSMYLIHWPLLVFYGYYRFETLTNIEFAALFAATSLLSILMYFCVEKPLRNNIPPAANRAPQPFFVLSSSCVMLFLALAGMYGYVNEGVTPLNKQALSGATIAKGKSERFQLIATGCNLQRLDDPRYCKMDRPYQILIFGNSHEPDGYNTFARIYRNNPEVNLISFGTLNDCEIAMTREGPASDVMDRNCKQRTARLNNNEFVKALDGVVYSSNQPFCEDKSNPPLCGNKQVSWQLLKYLRTLNPNLAVAVMGGYINTRYDCADLYNRFGTFSSCKDPGYISYNPFDEHAAIAALSHPDLADYYFIDKTVLLCPKATLQSCMVQAKGQPLFYDGHHLTLAFATLLGEKIASSYAQQLVKAGFPAPLPHVM